MSKCQFCHKVLSKEKGEEDHGCLDCAGYIYIVNGVNKMKYLAGLLLLEPLVLTGLIAFTDYTPKNGFMAYLFSLICLVFGAILIIHDNDQRRDL